jgi:hypothetical protein
MMVCTLVRIHIIHTSSLKRLLLLTTLLAVATATRTDSHSLSVSVYLLYIFFLLWPHFGFDMLFVVSVLLFALREAFKL